MATHANTTVHETPQALDFAASLAAYVADRDDYNTHPTETDAREAQYQAALAGAWKLRPVTRADGIAYARFMLEELDGGIPKDQDNFADAVEATLRALLTEQPSGIVKQIGDARFAIENAQGDVASMGGLFNTMADAIGPGTEPRAIELSAPDYCSALFSLANYARTLADAFDGPVGALIEVERALGGGE